MVTFFCDLYCFGDCANWGLRARPKRLIFKLIPVNFQACSCQCFTCLITAPTSPRDKDEGGEKEVSEAIFTFYFLVVNLG